MKRDWYRIEAKADDAADIYVFGDIGKSYWDDDTVTAQKFIADLKALPPTAKTIRVHVSSMGGSVFDAHAIANALRAERDERGRTIDVRIEAIAASAATIVTSAGNPIRIADNAMMMIHEPSGMEWGTASAMRKMADVLDAIKKSIISAYRWVSNKTEDELATMMAETTWMDAATAVEAGFATEIMTDGPVVTARFDPSTLARLGEIPEPFQARVTALLAPDESTPRQSVPPDVPAAAAATDVLRLCREADCLDLAEGFIAAAAPLADVQASLAQAVTAKQAAAARSQEITALCATAKLPDLAAGYVAGGMAIAAVRDHLTRITAKLQAGEIDSSLSPDAHGAAKTPRIDAAAIFAARSSNKE